MVSHCTLRATVCTEHWNTLPKKDVPIFTGSPSNLFSDSLVVLLLQSRHLHPEDLLHFGWQRFLHILLHSAQEKRLQDFVKALVAILSTFPVILLKILPELKPGNRKEKKGRSQNSSCLVAPNSICWIPSCCSTRQESSS